jgi:steroid Delta-isomerase
VGVDASLLLAHVERFNAGVRRGDFTEMVAFLAPDARMDFVGAPAGPFVGRDAIAAAYREQPPTDEIVLLGEPRLEGDCVVADYACAGDERRAGRLLLEARDGEITHLTVTFEKPPSQSPKPTRESRAKRFR